MIRSVSASLMLPLFALLMSMAPSARAAESYDNCTGFITSLPATIATQGTWCLKQDLATAVTSGNAIQVTTSNVTIDCNDFKIGGLAAGAGTQTNGIVAINRLNVTVRRCNIRGFYIGVFFSGASSGGHTLEDNRFDNNTAYGIYVEGDASLIQRNRLFGTGGSTVSADAFGIVAVDSVDILGNTVFGVVARVGGNGSAYGIKTTFNGSGRLVGNGVKAVVKDGTGKTYGIYNTSSDRMFIRENDVVGDGTTGSIGITCTNDNGDARDNLLTHFAVAISTCFDGGGNAVIP